MSAAEVANRYLETSPAPVGQWRLDEGRETTAGDSSGYANNGALQNGPAWTTGKFGTALQFSGAAGQRVQAPSSSSLNTTTALTVEAWVKRGSTGAWQGIANRYDTNDKRSWTLDFMDDGRVLFRMTADGTANTVVDLATTNSYTSTTQWYHVVATYDGATTTAKLYVNGANDGVLTSTPSAVFGGVIDVAVSGYDTTGSSAFNGTIDEVRIYNRALSASEVQARYQSQPEGQETVHYYLGGKEVAYKVGGTLYFPLQDHLGSTAVVTNSAGALVESTAYYPYGATRTGAITTTEEKFTGQRLDSTGLYYYGARYYDPGIGRFISADTVVQSLRIPGFLNRYTYTLNNPLKYVDPSGHRMVWIEDWMYLSGGHWSRTADEPEPPAPEPPGPAPSPSPTPPAENARPTQPEVPVVVVAVGAALAVTAPVPGVGEVVIGVGVTVGLAAGAYYVGREIGEAIGNAISQSSSSDKSKGNAEADGGTVQKGGKTVKDSTAKELNKYNGQARNAGEWGKALEGLKKDKGIPSRDHGTIKANGDYYDTKGNKVGNIGEYLP